MMERQLNCILLVDDNDADNYLHKLVIDKAGITEKVVAVESGEEALAFLRSKENGQHPQPDLIFLDINMPRMNGWEFLEAYSKLDKWQQGGIVVVMLTTSLNPDDEKDAKTNPLINGFKSKPLTQHILQEILEHYFSDRL